MVLRRILLALLAAFCVARGTGAQHLYSNPVIPDKGVADPFLLKWNGEYYLYATGNPIIAYHSTDLVQWEEIGPVLYGSGAADAWNQADVWAPEVVYRNGRFYLYYTASRASDDWRIGEMARRIGVGVSESPRGPFVDSGRPLTPGWGIDGHVFTDPDDGSEYLFYSYLYEPRLPGAGLVVDRMERWDTAEGKPSHVTRGSKAWEDKDGDPNNGSLRYTNEAPTVLKRGDTYYMMYSGGSWDLPTYAMAYATSDRVLKEGLAGPGWEKAVAPILRSTPLVEGPGHNSVTLAPNNVDDITAYHARVVPFKGPGDRQTFIDRLYWNHDRLYMQPPTTGFLTAPDRPLFGDLFNRPDGALGEQWEMVRGSWSVSRNQARSTGSALALTRTEPLAHYVIEANVRFSGGEGEGAAGVAAYYLDDENRVDVLLDRGRRLLVTRGTLDGMVLPEVITPLPAEFRFDVYHQLLVTKNHERLAIKLDGINRQVHRFAMGTARAGLQTHGTVAEFDGFALTAHFEDQFEDPDASDWTSNGGAWLVEEGALHQVAGGGRRYTALKGDPTESYEFAASVRFRDQETTDSRAGIVAAAESNGSLVLAGFDRTIWPYARFHVEYVTGDGVRDAFSAGLPRGFVYEEFHTIRVVKQRGAFTFYLDGIEIAAAHFPVESARPGLFTEGVRAAFDGASMKRLVVPVNWALDGSFESQPWENTSGSPEHPWRLSGGAFINMCCAHSGTYRLVLPAEEAEAEQTLRSVPPGRYTLHAIVSLRDAEANLQIDSGGPEAERVSTTHGDWSHVSLDFDAGEATPRIVLRGRPLKDGGYVAVDDVYVVSR